MKGARTKYQFTIIINNLKSNNSAATKAVLDCREIFACRGYLDYTLYFSDTSNKMQYIISLIIEIGKFLFKIEKGSVVGVQYPLLNNVFKYFIKIAKLKKVTVFAIIHDVESLRSGGKDAGLVKKEVENLNYYDCLIGHNEAMLEWLRQNGVTTKLVPLILFDYLADKSPNDNGFTSFSKSVVFAGNLSKSAFIYELEKINGWNFKLYGPNFSTYTCPSNVRWIGEFKPDDVVYKLDGDFGLIWDGDSIDVCDEIMGNYLKYNNPHKLSLYLAAGIPVIAPNSSAIAALIKEYRIGILINSIHDLENVNVDSGDFKMYKDNCKQLQQQVTQGAFFIDALKKVEAEI